jgi:protein O-GlcNAc transferase
MPLEGHERTEWVCFERALVLRDMFTGGERTFLSTQDAKAFRSMIYAQYGLP